MAAEELRQHRERITGARVVLHRARAERIEMRVDGEVQLRQPSEVTHGLELGHFRQSRTLATAKLLGHFGGSSRLRILPGGAAPGARMFEDQRLFDVAHRLRSSTSANAWA